MVDRELQEAERDEFDGCWLLILILAGFFITFALLGYAAAWAWKQFH